MLSKYRGGITEKFHTGIYNWNEQLYAEVAFFIDIHQTEKN
ncbi:hypothetical protein [Flavobacterium luteolum]|nr:hypothetical protein [Flavobacterium luteolum]